MQPGDVIADRFEVEQLSGAGGMGEVYRGRDRLSGDPVAVKVLAEAARGAHEQRFAREAAILAELRHPGIVRYVAHGTMARGVPYLVMEWLDGEDLGARLARQRLSMEETAQLVGRIAEALGAAHSRGVVHRDLKPGNLFLQDGDVTRVKVLDFGIARFGGGARETRTGTIVGTPGYMAPEQAQGHGVVDARTDVFTLGCVLFECLTGRAAFVGENMMALLAKILFEESPRMSELSTDMPEGLDHLVARMLSKDPAGRPPDGAAVAAALAALGPLDSAPRVSSGSRAPELTEGEQRLVSVALIGPPDADSATSGSAASRADEAPLSGEAPTIVSADAGGWSALRQVVSEYQGKLSTLADGSLIATLLGRGIATDRAAQAAHCALGIRRLLPDRPMALATGRGEVGGRTPAGEAIDRAAQVLARERRAARARPAASGSGLRPIRLDEVTASLLGSRFDIGGDEAGLELRGERGPVEGARTLLGKQTACVGRERELALLESMFSECAEEPVARAVLVTSPAGVGKSRLAYELVQRLDPTRQDQSLDDGGHAPSRVAESRSHPPVEVWIGQGDPLSAGSPFGLLGQALRRAFGLQSGELLATRQKKIRARVARHVPASEAGRVAEFLGELTGTPFPDDASVELRAARQDLTLMGDQMRRAFEDFLLVECAAQPVVLLLEDLHWGDLPTVRFIEGALRNLRDRPLMVLALARPEVHEIFPRLWADRGLQEVRLTELTRRASERLVRQILGETVSADVVARLIQQADGHALYLEELIRAVAEGHGDAPPGTVLAMVQTRIEAIEPEARRVLRAASVFGQTFWRGGIASLLGGSRRVTQVVVEWLGELVKREVIFARGDTRFPGEPEYAFRHALVREAAHAMLTENDRMLGHRLAGEWLESQGEGDAMTLAEHFERGGEPTRAVGWYRRAAKQALEGDDLEGTIQRVERGIACGARDENLGALRLVQAIACRWRGELASTERHGLEAMQWLPLGSAPWYEALNETLTATARTGNLERARTLIEALSATPPEAHARAAWIDAIARAAYATTFAGLYDVADGLLARIDDATPPSPAVEARIYAARAVRALVAGETGPFLRLLERSRACYEKAGDRRNACMKGSDIGYGHLQLGQYAEAERWLRSALATAEGIGLYTITATARQNLGIALARQGKLDEAQAVEEASIEEFRAQGNPRMVGASQIYLAKIAALQGDLERAEREATAAVDASDKAPPIRAGAYATLSEVLLARGRAPEALDAAKQAVAIVASLGGQIEEGESLIRLVHAEALDAAGEREAARAVIAEAQDRLLARADKIGDPDLRASFLEQVPENARTQLLAKQWSPPPPTTRGGPL